MITYERTKTKCLLINVKNSIDSNVNPPPGKQLAVEVLVVSKDIAQNRVHAERSLIVSGGCELTIHPHSLNYVGSLLLNWKHVLSIDVLSCNSLLIKNLLGCCFHVIRSEIRD